eukprot:IDg14462t1
MAEHRHSKTSSSKHDIGYLLNSHGASSASASTGRATGRATRSSTTANVSDSRTVLKRKSKDRPHECETCQFSFAQRSDLGKHIRT